MTDGEADVTTTSEVLLYARDLIAQGFCKDASARDAQGKPIRWESPDARAWCQVGARAFACNQMRTWTSFSVSERYLTQVIGEVNLISWNNAPERTQAEVVEAFDAAARLAKEAGD